MIHCDFPSLIENVCFFRGVFFVLYDSPSACFRRHVSNCENTLSFLARSAVFGDLSLKESIDRGGGFQRFSVSTFRSDFSNHSCVK